MGADTPAIMAAFSLTLQMRYWQMEPEITPEILMVFDLI